MNRIGSRLSALFAAVVAPSAACALDGFTTVPFQGPAAPVSSNHGNVDQPSVTLGFNIVLNYVNPLTAGEAAAFAAAEAQWESYITGYLSNDVANTNVNIDVNLGPIDGPGQILGSAGPQTAKLNAAQNAVTSTWLYTQTGAMNFDNADTPGLIGNGSVGSVVLTSHRKPSPTHIGAWAFLRPHARW